MIISSDQRKQIQTYAQRDPKTVFTMMLKDYCDTVRSNPDNDLAPALFLAAQLLDQETALQYGFGEDLRCALLEDIVDYQRDIKSTDYHARLSKFVGQLVKIAPDSEGADLAIALFDEIYTDPESLLMEGNMDQLVQILSHEIFLDHELGYESMQKSVGNHSQDHEVIRNAMTRLLHHVLLSPESAISSDSINQNIIYAINNGNHLMSYALASLPDYNLFCPESGFQSFVIKDRAGKEVRDKDLWLYTMLENEIFSLSLQDNKAEQAPKVDPVVAFII